MRYSVSFSTYRKQIAETFEALDQVYVFLKQTNCDTDFIMIKKEDDPNDNLPEGAPPR